MINHDIEILVFSRETVQEFVTDNPYLWISVRDPGSQALGIPNNPNLVAALLLDFEDLDIEPKLLNNSDLKPFTTEDAKSILKVLQVTEKYINTIVINCEVGISRSSAIAAALAKILDQSNERFFNPQGPYRPNKYIYKTLLDTYMDSHPIGK